MEDRVQRFVTSLRAFDHFDGIVAHYEDKIEEFRAFIEGKSVPRRQIGERQNPLEYYSEEEFKKHFAFKKQGKIHFNFVCTMDGLFCLFSDHE